MIIPVDLRARTEAAILRITSGQAPMCVPVDQTDPDVVLAEWLRASAPMPPAGAEPEIFGYWCSPHFATQLGIFHREISGSIRDHCDVTELLDRIYVTRLQAEVSALQQRLTIADQRIDDVEHARDQCLEVNPTSLRALLNALVGAPHEIRELQACRGIPDNPIDQLLREYNAWIDSPAEKSDKQ